MDRFDEAAREISWPTPGDPERRIRLTPHGADAVAQALRTTHNAALEAAVAAMHEAEDGSTIADIIRALKVPENGA